MFRFMLGTLLQRYIVAIVSPWILLGVLVTSSALGAYTHQSAAAGVSADFETPALRTAAQLQRELSDIQMEWRENASVGAKNPVRLHIAANRIRAALCGMGTVRYCLEYAQIPQAKHVDLDRLAYAVSVAETSHCTAGTGISKNNCHGIIECSKGACAMKHFANTNESFLAFKKLWMRAYGDHFPTLEDAKRYSAGPGDTWLERVSIAYYGKAEAQQRGLWTGESNL